MNSNWEKTLEIAKQHTYLFFTKELINDFKELAEALEANPKLHSLSFKEVDLSTTNIKYLGKVLKGENSLEQLSLFGSRINSEGLQYLIDCLKTNKNFKQLSIYLEDMDSKGAQSLSNLLKENKENFKRFTLYSSNLDVEGAKYLSEALKENQHLKILHLKNNEIGDKGVQYLSEALKKNHSLENLHLSDNNIGPEGVKYLSDLLKENTKIKNLDFGIDKISKKEVAYLKEAFKKNYTLLELCFHDNKTEKSFRVYLERNQELFQYLRPLRRAIKTNQLLTNDVIDNILSNMDKWIAIYPLAKGSYPDEAYQLLTALKNLNTTAKESASKKAQLVLLPSFKNEVFHQYANKMCSYIQKENIRNYLTAYINRVESYKDYTKGFWFFSTSRGINRKANYLLAKQLRDNLEEPDSKIERVFANLVTQREEIIKKEKLDKELGYQQRGIHSNELNKIITTANAFIA